MLGALLAYAYGRRRANRGIEEYFLALEDELISYEQAYYEDVSNLLRVISILLDEQEGA